MKGSPEHAADVELLKAVAQAWHAQSGNPKPSPAPSDDAAGARRAGGRGRRPSRFKLEAARAAAAAAARRRRSWDFAQSLWDTYELVAVAQKLESSLVFDQAVQLAPAPAPHEADADGARGGKRARQSNRSLRSWFLGASSRRFGESNVLAG